MRKLSDKLARMKKTGFYRMMGKVRVAAERLKRKRKQGHNTPSSYKGADYLKQGGQVANMGLNGEVRFNLLWRNSLGGRPQPIAHTNQIVLSSLQLMMDSGLSLYEKPRLNAVINQLYEHFELGKSVLPTIMKSVYYQYGQAMGFRDDHEAYYSFYAGLTRQNERVRQQYFIPHNGYVVQPAFTKGATISEATVITGTDGAGVVLKVLNCVNQGITNSDDDNTARRNFYAGGGYVEIEIPLAKWRDIEGAMKAQATWMTQLDRTAWVNFFLVCYLADPTNPRRQSIGAGGKDQGQGHSEWVWWDNEQARVKRSLMAPRRMSNVTTGEGTDSEKGKWSKPCAHDLAALPGANLHWECGPLWYPETGWHSQMKADYCQSLAEFEVVKRLDEDSQQLLMRDLLTELSYGEPILSNLLPLLYGDDKFEGRQVLGGVALNVEKYCAQDLGSLFNGYSNIDSSNRVLIFPVKDLPGELLALRLIQCVELVWREIAISPNRANRNLILSVDERGSIMAQKGGDQLKWYFAIMHQITAYKDSGQLAGYFATMYKRSQAYDRKIVSLDENYQTFGTSAGVQLKYDLSIPQVIWQLTPQADEVWAGDLNLTPQEREKLLNLKIGKTLMLRNAGGKKTKVWDTYRARKHKKPIKLRSTRPNQV